MIAITDKSERVTTGGTATETARYHIDESAIGHVSMILEDMYKFPERAVLREYLANAIDAHTLSGTDKKVDVTLPTFLDSRLVIRDYGPGLSKADTDRLLRGYGASGEEKRTSNDFIGGFGIGAKCAYSITKTFVYTIWHGGMKRVWINSKDDFDVSVATLASEEPSDEPTGIEVAIPIASTSDSFARGVHTTFQTEVMRVIPFLEKPEMLNFAVTEEGEGNSYEIPSLPSPAATINMTLRDANTEFNAACKLYAKERSYRNNNNVCCYPPLRNYMALPLLVIGGNAIELDATVLDTIVRDVVTKQPNKIDVRRMLKNTVFELPIGSVQLAPTRESVKYSPRTHKILNLLVQTMTTQEFNDELLTQVTSGDDPIRKRHLIARDYALKLNSDTWYDTDVGLMFPPDWIFNSVHVRAEVRKRSDGTPYCALRSDIPTVTRPAFNSFLFDSEDLRFFLYVTKSTVTGEEIAQRVATHIVDTYATHLQREYCFALVMVEATRSSDIQAEEIPWVKDGSATLITEKDIPEQHNRTYFTQPKQKRQRRSRNLSNAVLTKLKVFTGDVVTDVDSNGKYLGRGDVKELRTGDKSGVCIILGNEYAVLNDLRMPRSLRIEKWGGLYQLARVVLMIKNESLMEILPKMFSDPTNLKTFQLFAMRDTDYTKATFNKGANGIEPLLTYVKRRLMEDIRKKKVDLELLFRTLEKRDRTSSCKTLLTSVVNSSVLRDTSSGRALLQYESYGLRFSEQVRNTTDTWAAVVEYLFYDPSLHAFDDATAYIEYPKQSHSLPTFGQNGLFRDMITQGKDRLSKYDNHPLTMTQWFRDTPDQFLSLWLREGAIRSHDSSVQNPLEHALARFYMEVPFATSFGTLFEVTHRDYGHDAPIVRDVAGKLEYHGGYHQYEIFHKTISDETIVNLIDCDPDFRAYVKRKIAHNKKA